ncbi:MAG: FAD-binding oxidoreductase [Pseudomonadota bacterium]
MRIPLPLLASCLLSLSLSLSLLGAQAGETVNDVTGLNPIEVAQVLAPTRLEEIVQAVREHPGPISIGGGRYSMGGQTATQGALQLDMRRFDRVLQFCPQRREVRVQAGITWRALLEFLDPHGLSPQIMQSYANFTVGGSLSVNVHGRYVGQGPMVLSVRSIRLVMADGRVLDASPTHNAELFYGAIGGYGGLGVIVEATLALDDNSKIARQTEVMPLSDYRGYFFAQVRDNPQVLLHNGVLYPGAYDKVRAVSHRQTEQPLTIEERLVPLGRDYKTQRLGVKLVAGSAAGRTLRETTLDPLVYRSEQVQWRNHEASLDVAELQPLAGADYSFALQEYFVPPAQLEAFVAQMGGILNRHQANVLNVSIRHARPDPGTLLAWAPEEVFALVIYYRQGTGSAEREAVAEWTRELIDAALAHQGRYYLPYQIHASRAQFLAAYPRADAFFALKKREDPTHKFRNKLWDAYYP